MLEEILIKSFFLFYSSLNSVNTRKDKGKGKMVESPADSMQRFGLSEDPQEDLMDTEVIDSDRCDLKIYIQFSPIDY